MPASSPLRNRSKYRKVSHSRVPVRRASCPRQPPQEFLMATQSTSTRASSRFGTSQTFNRFEDSRLLIGQGRFTDNLKAEHAAQVVFVRSPQAHARLTSIDTTEAQAMPGVIAVITGAEL